MQKNKNSRKQSNLLMDVVMIYFYSKRFRFAPSFNYYDHRHITNIAIRSAQIAIKTDLTT